jgi:methylphosphotriester-DNA--protein-cysteine methyltransferase
LQPIIDAIAASLRDGQITKLRDVSVTIPMTEGKALVTSFGRTPHVHLVRLRLERAMTLMIDTNEPLSAIALAAGFSDQAHFSNRFRQMYGQTPTQWRKSHRCVGPIERRALIDGR